MDELIFECPRFWPTAEGKSSLYPESVGDIVGEWEE